MLVYGRCDASLLTESQIAVLIECWHQFSSLDNLAEVYKLLVTNARKLARSRHAAVNLFEKGDLHCVCSTWEGNKEQAGTLASLGIELIGQVIEDGTGRCAEHIAFSNEGLHNVAIACVPMKVGKEIIGTIQVYESVESSDFTKVDLNGLQLLADHSAVIIERLKLQNQILLESRRIQGIFQALTDGIILVDANGIPILYNQAVESMFFPDGKENYAFAAYLDNVIKINETAGSSEVVLLKPHEMVLSNRFVTVSGPDGKCSEKVISIRNISEQRAVERRFSQFYALVLHRYNRLLVKMWKYRNRKNMIWRRLVRKQRIAMYHLVTLTDLRNGPLRIERENCNLLDIYIKVKRRFVKSFEKAIISIDDHGMISCGGLKGRFDCHRMFQMFHIIFRKAKNALKSRSCIVWNAVMAVDCLEISAVLEGNISLEKISEKMLDWNIQVDRILSGKTSILDLDLPLLNHIVRAHKGTVSIVNKGEFVSIKIVLPLE